VPYLGQRTRRVRVGTSLTYISVSALRLSAFR